MIISTMQRGGCEVARGRCDGRSCTYSSGPGTLAPQSYPWTQCMHMEALQKADCDVRTQHLSAGRHGGVQAHVKHVSRHGRSHGYGVLPVSGVIRLCGAQLRGPREARRRREGGGHVIQRPTCNEAVHVNPTFISPKALAPRRLFAIRGFTPVSRSRALNRAEPPRRADRRQPLRLHCSPPWLLHLVQSS
jgi:hypothetical protein